jgi:hypothetical protein
MAFWDRFRGKGRENLVAVGKAVGIERREKIGETSMARTFRGFEERKMLLSGPEIAALKNNTLTFKNFKTQASRLILTKKKIAFDVGLNLKTLRDSFGHNLFPDPSKPQVLKKVLFDMSREMSKLLTDLISYSVVTRTFLQVLIAEYRQLNIGNININLRNELAVIIKRLILMARNNELRIRGLKNTLILSELSTGKIDIVAIRRLALSFYFSGRLDKELYDMCVRFSKASGGILRTDLARLKSLKRLRRRELWAKTREWINVFNIIHAVTLVGTFAFVGSAFATGTFGTSIPSLFSSFGKGHTLDNTVNACTSAESTVADALGYVGAEVTGM